MSHMRRETGQSRLGLGSEESIVGCLAVDVDGLPEERGKGVVEVARDEGTTTERTRVEMGTDAGLKKVNVKDGGGG